MEVKKEQKVKEEKKQEGERESGRVLLTFTETYNRLLPMCAGFAWSC